MVFSQYWWELFVKLTNLHQLLSEEDCVFLAGEFNWTKSFFPPPLLLLLDSTFNTTNLEKQAVICRQRLVYFNHSLA